MEEGRFIVKWLYNLSGLRDHKKGAGLKSAKFLKECCTSYREHLFWKKNLLKFTDIYEVSIEYK